jgi:glutamyl-tRNA reductase
MEIFLLGVSHKTAPVELREQLALPPSHIPRALHILKSACGLQEAAILSTCNRAEIYAVGNAQSAARLERFLGRYHTLPSRVNAPKVPITAALYRSQDAASVRHLFNVASGVESMVVGESEIQGQVKTALETAHKHDSIGIVLDELFRRAIACGKRARSETAIGRGAQSVGAAAVELARQIFGPLSGHRVLLLGAGEMSAATARCLVSSGASSVIVANRTLAKGQELAAELRSQKADATAVHWDELAAQLQKTDIVIASTGAPHQILHLEQVQTAMKGRRHRPLFMIDIAVPRDIDPAAHQLEDVFLFDIDDLRNVVETNRNGRAEEIASVEQIIEDEMESWQRWMNAHQARPVMSALAHQAAELRDAEVENAMRSARQKLDDLDEASLQVIDELLAGLGRSIAGKLIHPPLRHLREAGETGSADVDVLRRAFNLETNNGSKKSSP